MKKIIKLLSIISLTATSSLSVISCAKKQIQIPKLTLVQEEIDIVNAINLKNTNNKNLNVKISDITMVKNPTFDGTNFTYDITIKQDAKTFLNNNFNYRIPEVSGNFDISNNKIINNDYILKYLPGKYLNYINGTADILSGTTNDFTLIMNSTDFSTLDHMAYYFKINNKLLNTFFKQLDLYNSNIILTKNDWRNKIFTQINETILDTDLGQGYAVCIHVIRNSNSGNFKVVYSSLTKKDEHSMPLPVVDNPWLPLTAFEANDIKDGSLIKTNNKFITLNKDILSELKDIYDAKLDNQDYGNKNWNVNSISKILENNNYSNTNLDYNTIAECIYNNWNINIVNNFLSKNYSRDFRDDNGDLVIVPIKFLTLQYDENNNYIKNNLNI